MDKGFNLVKKMSEYSSSIIMLASQQEDPDKRNEILSKGIENVEEMFQSGIEKIKDDIDKNDLEEINEVKDLTNKVLLKLNGHNCNQELFALELLKVSMEIEELT